MFLGKKLITVAVAAAALSACGGGGPSDSPAPLPTPDPVTPAPPAPPVVIPADLQTAIPSLTYPQGSTELVFVTAVNDFRSKIGLGLLAQNEKLDQAAKAHLDYVLHNDVLNGGTVDMRTIDPVTGRPMFHIEKPGLNFYTGVEELARGKAAGYNGVYVGEQITFGGTKGVEAAFASLTSTVYHRAGLMFQSPREIGIAAGQDRSRTITFEVGFAIRQRNASDFVGVYPAQNQSGVGLHAGVEAPNPFPDLSTSNDDFPTKTGYPVSVVVPEGKELDVTSFTITEAGTNAPLTARLMTKSNDPNKLLAGNMAFLIASAPFKPNTVYTVSFGGRVDQVAITRNWQFTTRP